MAFAVPARRRRRGRRRCRLEDGGDGADNEFAQWHYDLSKIGVDLDALAFPRREHTEKLEATLAVLPPAAARPMTCSSKGAP